MNPATQQIENANQGVKQICEEMNNFARELMEVAMRSVAAMTKGWDETTRSTGGLVQESWSRAMTAGKTIMDAKSMPEAMNMHVEFMKDCFDCWMTGTGKISEISVRTTKEAIDPVAKHANNAISKVMQKARAN